MLSYFNYGRRDYLPGRYPVSYRNSWEFEVVVDGELGVLLEGDRPHYVRGCLLVFPPSMGHGWVCRGGRDCEIVVMQFQDVPGILKGVAQRNGWLKVKLKPREMDAVCRLRDEVEPHYLKPTTKSALYYEKARVELTLLALRDEPDQPLSERDFFATTKVRQAMAWYADHLEEAPTVDAVAEAVCLSSTHLRRLFRKVRKESPLSTMTEIRMARAEELLRDGRFSVGEVGEALGFSEASVFSRSFKDVRGVSPDAWRERLQKTRKAVLNDDGRKRMV